MKILAISRNENSVYKKQNVEFKGSINPAKLTNSVSGAKQNSSQSILKKIFSLFKPKQKNADQLMQQYTALCKRISLLEQGLRTGVKPLDVLKAEQDLKFYNTWNVEEESIKYRKLANETAMATTEGLGFFAKMFNNKYAEVYDKTMQPFFQKHDSYKKIEKDLPFITKIINDSKMNAKHKKETLKALRPEKEALKEQLIKCGAIKLPPFHRSKSKK